MKSRLRRSAPPIAALILIFGVLLGRQPTAVADAGSASIAVQVGSAPDGPALPNAFLGFSFEYQALRSYAGRDPNHIDPVLLGLVHGITTGGSGVIRIGGNSTDQTWWPMPGVVPPGGVSFALTPDWLRVARALAGDLRAQLILGVNLAADSPTLAGAEARALVQGIGRSRIRALEIGNEADLYGMFAWYRDRLGRLVFSRPRSYTIQSYISDYDRWRALVPAVPLAGPSFAGATWMGSLSTLLGAEPQLSLVTFHRYPTRACVHDPTASSYPSIPTLLSDSSSAGLAQQVAPFVATTHDDHVRFRLDELNSASCSGRAGVSDTFASSLWVLDTLFNLASVGVDGINVHTLPGSAYQPFTVSRRGSRWTASVRPLYYGLLAFNQAFPAGAQPLPVSAPAGPVKAWATQTPDGRVRVTLINKDPAIPATVELSLPGTQSPLTEEALTAPALSAKTGVTLGGQTFGPSTSTGVLAPDPHPATVAPDSSGGYSVALPAGSALILTR